MTKKRYIWIGIIPDIFGYGICVAEESRALCMQALEKAYEEWKEVQPDPDTNFKKSFNYYGGRVEKITLGKSYFEDFAY